MTPRYESHRLASAQQPMPKVRAFVINAATRKPAAGVVVRLMVLPDEGVEAITAAILVSDPCGYVSFSLLPVLELSAEPKDAWLQLADAAATKVSVREAWPVEGRSPRAEFPFHIEAASVPAGCPPDLPSIQEPDVVDWRISPYSFSVHPSVSFGDGDGCCSKPVPSVGAERQFLMHRVVYRPDRDARNSDSNSIRPVNPFSRLGPLTERQSVIRRGEVLEFRQTWYALQHSLGSIAYSLALAPCESVNLAVIDWSRQDTIVRQDQVTATEALFHNQRRDRTIEESVSAALSESQKGWSLLAGTGGGAGVSGNANADVSAEAVGAATTAAFGIPIPVGLGLGGNAFSSQMFGIGGGISSSWGNRDVAADSIQELHDRVTQATTVARSQSSTTIVQTTLAESNVVQTRTVTNHNHCHALTIQYYEVLRNFRVVTEHVRTRPAVLVPYALQGEFTWTDALRHRSILEAVLLDPRLAGCFDAIVRLRLCGDVYDATPAADAPPRTDTSSSTPSTDPGTIKRYKLRIETGDRETWGAIWVWAVTASGNKQIWFKESVNSGKMGSEGIKGYELPRGYTKEVDVVSGDAIGLKPSDISQVKVEWVESNGADAWSFKAISLEIDTTSNRNGSLLINGQQRYTAGTEIVRFTGTGHGHQSWTGNTTVDIAPPPPAPPPPPPQNTPPASKPATRPDKAADACCEHELLAHLNGNIGYYNRAVWLLQEPVERRIMLEAALSGHEALLGGLDDRPLAASGNYIAFGYEPERAQDERRLGDPVESIITLPARGLFAEAQLGHCNSCEKRDVTRFWDWQESPCATAPTIENIKPGPTGGATPTLTPMPLPAAVVQVAQTPAAPDPSGLSAALTLLGKGELFRDMSMSDDVQKLVTALANGSMSLPQAKQAAEQIKAKQDSAPKPDTPAGSGKTRATPSEHNAGRQLDKLAVIDQAQQQGQITAADARDAAKGVLGGDILFASDTSSGQRQQVLYWPAGIDVSHHQGPIDWKKVKEAGMWFAFIKATEGKSVVDSKFATNWAGARSAGLIRGAYHYFHHDVDPAEQADNFMKTVGTIHPGDLPPVLDVEAPLKGVSVNDALDRIGNWCDEIYAFYGLWPIIYTYAAYWHDTLGDSARFGDHPLWIANYTQASTPKIPAGWSDWNFWQYSDAGNVEGIAGRVDLNLFNGTLLELSRLARFRQMTIEI